MTPNATEIEKLVRQALQAWTGSVAASPVATTSTPVPSTLLLADSVISTETLRGRLAGINTLQVSDRAIVTPAVKDLCREKKIAIERAGAAVLSTGNQASSSSPAATPLARPQRLVVAGTSPWMSAIQKQLCPKQAKVLEKSMDDATALRSIQESLANGHQAGVLWVESAFATGWQAARIEALRPVVVTQWSEVPRALREVPLNLLIIPTHGWSIPAVCNAARTLFEHLKRTN
ncbi:MAG: hypothetical protein MUD03_12955 [Pirellula sp.]|nr:hypothetical protein [Pirellula sp.]